MEIRKNGEALDLGKDFTMQIEDTSPVYNDRGSQSVPATVPVTGRNVRLLGGIHRTDSAKNPNLPEETVDIVSGAYVRRGILNVTEAGRKSGITFNVGFDNSTAYSKWKQRGLKELSNLPIRMPGEGGSILDNLQDVYMGKKVTDERDEYQFDDIAIFPIAINREEREEGIDAYDILNAVRNGDNPILNVDKVYRSIDGERIEVDVPAWYGITPFLKVWKVLELVFEDLGIEILSNPFKNDPELERVVVLNNTADTICRNRLDYRDMMPDCEVQEFLNSLWVRFGLVYNINFDARTVQLALLKNLLNKRGGKVLDALISEEPLIRYNNPQYVKLSAATSIEGAKPAKERFEDFTEGLDTTRVKIGANVSQWKKSSGGRWDGEAYDSYYDDREDPDPGDWDYPEPPDPGDDRDDDRDERDDDRDDDRDYYSLRAPRAVTADSEQEQLDVILAREFVTGNWFKLDSTNGLVRASSTGFFNWDPKPEGIEAYDLSSEDEFVAVGSVFTWINADETYSGIVPMYLTGARHFHSYIAGAEKEDGETEETPLSFMIAYTYGGSTFGRLSPEDQNGHRITMDDGSQPELTLYFQFRDGLFARYWREFDEILRHGNREIEVPVRMAKHEINGFDLLSPVIVGGLRCLPDRLTYTLPAPKNVNVEMALRAIQTQGDYDIVEEQNIPGIRMGGDCPS